ncbi:Na+/H+ antiporter [Vibrio ponticus]|nr:Na+/H+ antiporter [Vibrio ponticus]
MRLVPMNFYAIFALLMVFAVAWFGLNVGKMRDHEIAASQGRGFDDAQSDGFEEARELDEELDITESDKGKVSDLVLPIVALIIATVASMLYTGGQALAEAGKPFALLGAFENTNVGTSLIYGGLVGLFVALFTVVKQGLPALEINRTLWIGAKSMFGAILILVFAWSIGTVIGDMKLVATCQQWHKATSILNGCQ